ncbi:thiamine phosphate synthase [Lachnoclostridium edouardi]|uniref:thiamine phosphate synthase n=1 Tax=Lachnoclostridium edouardi TaxID=1926283 RepID=UPI000C7967E3|nr:thiamine phosphate synthase [Lachnoclostridium edouardi]MDO4278544.1 thiamine phosphate synthase [Lachnoclostridium edouardi]
MTGKVIAVTNRKLCTRPFEEQLERAAKEKPYAVILREKDLSEQEYEKLAQRALEICEKYHVKCILHTYTDVAKRLKCPYIHLPLWRMEQLEKEEPGWNTFTEAGASVHSLEEAKKAEELGASYITAGHIFVTDCKKGLEPRGLEFLKNICQEVKIPVFAIGGIHPYNQEEPVNAGAAGVCMMSEFMKI